MGGSINAEVRRRSPNCVGGETPIDKDNPDHAENLDTVEVQVAKRNMKVSAEAWKAFQVYQKYEDWSSETEKTDYTYSPLSKYHTREVIPGFTIRPNLCRSPIKPSSPTSLYDYTTELEQNNSVRSRHVKLTNPNFDSYDSVDRHEEQISLYRRVVIFFSNMWASTVLWTRNSTNTSWSRFASIVQYSSSHFALIFVAFWSYLAAILQALNKRISELKNRLWIGREQKQNDSNETWTDNFVFIWIRRTVNTVITNVSTVYYNAVLKIVELKNSPWSQKQLWMLLLLPLILFGAWYGISGTKENIPFLPSAGQVWSSASTLACTAYENAVSYLSTFENFTSDSSLSKEESAKNSVIGDPDEDDNIGTKDDFEPSNSFGFDLSHTANSVLESLQFIWDSFGSTVTSASHSLYHISKFVLDSFLYGVAWVTLSLNQISKFIWDSFGYGWQWVSKAVLTCSKFAEDLLVFGLSSISDLITQGFKNTWNLLILWVESMLDFISMLWYSLGSILVNFQDLLIQSFVFFWDSCRVMSGSVWDSIASGAMYAWNYLIFILQYLWDSCVLGFRKFFVEFPTDLFMFVWDLCESSSTNVRDFVLSCVHIISYSIYNSVNFLYNLLYFSWHYVLETSCSIGASIAQLLSAVWHETSPDISVTTEQVDTPSSFTPESTKYLEGELQAEKSEFPALFTAIEERIKYLEKELQAQKNQRIEGEASLQNYVNLVLERQLKSDTTLQRCCRRPLTRYISQSCPSVDLTKEVEELRDGFKKETNSEIEKLRQEIRNLDIVPSGQSDMTFDVALVKRIVHEAIKIYDADKTGRADYALESAGGRVVSIRCTKAYTNNSPSWNWLPFLGSGRGGPDEAIRPGTAPGECWAFQGAVGHLALELSYPVRITGFTMEHIAKELSPSGTIDSAPQHFSVWGLKHADDLTEQVLFGEYVYEDNGQTVQYFAVQNVVDRPYKFVELKIISNHGHPDYTCLYRIRVHGTVT